MVADGVRDRGIVDGVRRRRRSLEKDMAREEASSSLFLLLWQSPWLVLVASCWIEATAGITYAYGTYSSVIKSSLQYDQRQISRLGVAKDLGDTVGLAAGFLCNLLPFWVVLFLGGFLILVGYGWIWLIVIHKVATLPFWMVCALIFVGTNGCTYLDTAALVSCIHNFPRNRGTVVGILKGFKGLSGAIFNQVYTSFLAPDQASFILMLAAGPILVVLALMFAVRPVHSSCAGENDADATTFRFLYGVCLVLAAYMLTVMLVQDLTTVSDIVNILFTIGLFLLVVLPLAAPISSTFCRGMKFSFFRGRGNYMKDPLLGESSSACSTSHTGGHLSIEGEEGIISKETTLTQTSLVETDALPQPLNQNRIGFPLLREEAAVDMESPQQGGDFTLFQALRNAEFWLLFFSVCFGSGSGVTAINNLGQMAQSQGYQNAHIFVSMINIWNFLGRLGGGYASEILSRSYGLPRPVALVAVQIIMSLGHIFFAMAWPGSIYAATLLVGLGYGAHWAIFPTTASELFGLKNFSVLYGFLCMAIPVGSLVFSGLIAGTVYDWQAQKQNKTPDNESLQCEGTVCFQLTFLIMAAVCVVGAVLSMVLVVRTRVVYSALYRKSHQREQQRKASVQD